MLTRLRISNFIIIDELEVDFEDGFNVITGETGAGKSIILGAISVLTGKKVDRTLVKKGEKSALIQGVFESRDGEEIIISREIKATGKSVAKIDGNIVTVAELKSTVEDYVTIFAQDDKLKFLSPSEQLHLYDSFVFGKVRKPLEDLKSLHDRIVRIKKSLETESVDHEKLQREKDFIEFQINEIDSANITEEDDKLDEELDYFENIKSIMLSHSEIDSILDGDDFSVLSMLSKVENRLSYLSGFSDDYEKLLENFNDYYYGLQDVSSELSSIFSRIDVDEERAYHLEKRRDEINNLKLKYGSTVDEIGSYRIKLDKDYEALLQSETNREELEKELSVLEADYHKLAVEVSKTRLSKAEEFSNLVTSSLKDLNFNDAVFKVDIVSEERITKNGYDTLTFTARLNSGMDFEEIKKIASGGELSRIMLAIWEVLSKEYSVPLLIFDEIDTGVGGMTANSIARKLYKVSLNHQIISVSHLLQMAVYADANYFINKHDDGETLWVEVKRLSEAELISEVQRLIGREASEGLSDEAVKMLEEVRREKKSLG